MDSHDICAILDQVDVSDQPCRGTALFSGGAEAMARELIDRADDLRMAASLIYADPAMAVRLMQGASDRAQLCARTLRIAQATGRRLAANRAGVDADSEHSEEAE